MEGVYFVLGMVAVFLLLGVLIVYKVKKKVEELEEEFKFLEIGSSNIANDLHRRIENEVRDLQFHNNETLLRIEKELCELQNIVDKNKKNLLKG